MTEIDIARERQAQRVLESGLDIFRRTIEQVNATSTLIQIKPEAFEDFVGDWCPRIKDWQELLTVKMDRAS